MVMYVPANCHRRRARLTPTHPLPFTPCGAICAVESSQTDPGCNARKQMRMQLSPVQ